jgi:single-stranded-DNA-specific exonuclease
MANDPPPRPRFTAMPYDFAAALEVSDRLGLRLPIATSLVRRGLDTPEAVRELIDGEPENDPFLLDDMDEAVEAIVRSVRSGELITVHGDYDADGVCATSIVVECLREMGAEVDWFLPDRRGGGYGVSQVSIDEMLARGTSLMITVDCGIGSRDEVAVLREAGVECVVTDHHEQPQDLPDCPVIHPARGDYPFPGLCGAGVAYKLATALRSEVGMESDHGVDLVALATVADLVPLTGENRSLVQRGLNRMRTSPRTGMRALMEAAGVSPNQVDAGALGFRLAPRINAAGRLYRADAGVELMLSSDPTRASQVAEELNRANGERRAVEREVMNGAEAARRDLSEEQLKAPALVIAGEGWHPGVIGIVASRLVEKYWRPVVLIALDGETGRGSGRSIPGFDLLGGISAGAKFLERFGGHRMAAGLEIRADQVEAFREVFTERAFEALGADPPERVTEIEGIVGAGGDGIDMEFAEQLDRMEPFGMGNPRPRLLFPAARLGSLRSMGKEGKHASFDLQSGSAKIKGVGFGLAGQLEALGDVPVDVEVEVEVNRWNDSVEARVVAREIVPLPAAPDETSSDVSAVMLDSAVWWERLAAAALDPLQADAPSSEAERGGLERRVIDRRSTPAIPAVLDLASTGDSVLVISCDAIVRRGLIAAADPSRIGGDPPSVAPGSASSAALEAEVRPGSVVFSDWDAALRHRIELTHFTHIAVVDPPFEPGHLEILASQDGGAAGPGFLHLLWHRTDISAARAALDLRWNLRSAAVEIWRALEGAGETTSPEEWEQALRAGEPARTLPPETLGRALCALDEAGRISFDPSASRPVPSISHDGGRLEESEVFNAAETYRERAADYLVAAADTGAGILAEAA